MTDFRAMRREYGDAPLQRRDLPADPLVLFRDWLHAAEGAGVIEPNAMALATCGEDGQPACRIVLLKGLDDSGLTFFTNYESDKARQIEGNARAATTFWWSLPRPRQVRIAGTVSKAPDSVSDAYFRSRPREAQLASAGSPQSRIVHDREELQAHVQRLADKHPIGPVPRPAHWGGYVLHPVTVEFWQGRDHRLHDRFRYTRATEGWRIDRVAP